MSDQDYFKLREMIRKLQQKVVKLEEQVQNLQMNNKDETVDISELQEKT